LADEMDWWTSLGQAVSTFLARYGLLAAFVLIAVEEAGVPSPAPADLLVLLLGVQARAGGAPLWQVVAVAEGATILGASVLYHLARRAGRDVVYRYGRHVGLGPERLGSVEARLRGASVWTVAVARLTPGVRVLVAVACGIFDVPDRVFLPGMAIGALAYLLVFALLGYYVGPPVAAALGNVHLPLSSLLSLVLFVVSLVWLARARRDAPRGAFADSGRARLRAGLAAGILAALCSALAVNALAGLVGAAAALATQPWAQAAPAQVVADQRRLVPLVASVLVFALVGASWGAAYGRWGEPLLRRLVAGDAARGIAFSTVPWALIVAAVILMTDQDDVGALVVALVQAFQQVTFGAVLGLAYPLLRARIAAGRGPLSPSQAAS
jgi:membrane protein DedA with SNARE-associated domain